MSPYLLALLIAALVFISCEVGCRLARKSEAGAASTQFGILQSASFGIVSLLLAFSFSVAANRYDSRRETLVAEANAIGTTILRADLLNENDAWAVRSDLRQYVLARLDFVAPDISGEAREQAAQRSRVLQGRIWATVMAASQKDPRSLTIPLLLSLNEMIDLSTKEAAVFTATLPTPILVILVLMVLANAGLFGAGYGRAGKRSIVAFTVLSIMNGLVFAAILDLNEPHAAFIRVNLTPLRDLRP